MKIAMRALLAIALLASATQLSCSVNDYCLNCERGDGGNGDGGGSDDSGMGSDDSGIDGGCIPTGPEECDGEDNDCDGLVDDEPITGVGVLCANQNGACAGGVTICSQGVIKCDKGGSPEVCNGLDDNCSGVPDEGDPGGGGKCGTDMGECIAGQYHCNAQSGMVECFGFIDHTGDPELCDGKDNDCDGSFDENVVFNPSACGPPTNVGECEFGTNQCQAGSQICTGAVFAKYETCNNKDDDCDSSIDEIFNTQTDIMNCGSCGNICMPTGRTCINTNNNTNGASCTMDAQCPGGACAVNSQPRCISGGCTFTCNAGYQNKDGMAANGCEFHCFATGAEECDGVDNDCDGNTDEGLTPPAICLSGGECGTNTVASCDGATGWQCHYPMNADLEFPETKCDGKNNDCDANTDEAQTNVAPGIGLGLACSVVPETMCMGSADDDNDGFANDGCPALGPAETVCNDTIDNDMDGLVNDGCPAREERGICKSTGTYTCDASNISGPPVCTITMPGSMPATESCDARDNDCDGKTDEGGASGSLTGQEWVDIGGGKQMMKYEASRPDSTATDQGNAAASDPANTSAFACSRQGVQPWTNIKYQDAVAACAKIGASLCSEMQWHRACSAVTPATYPVAAPGTGTFIEAEDYESAAFAGSPVHAWVEDYTSPFSGISDIEATPNVGTSVSAANAPTQAPYVQFSVTLGATSNNWHVWVKVFANNSANDAVWVGRGTATPVTTTTFPSGNYNSWQWLDAALGNNVGGAQTIRLYMRDDGVKVDKIYIFNGTTTASAINSAETINGKGGKWAYASNANTYDANTCNGDDYDTSAAAGDQDDILTTGALPNCQATTGGGIFDLSGNVKEWTLRHAPGENPIRGGASNNTGEGISCPLNFTLADDDFFFPNIGFRCCR